MTSESVTFYAMAAVALCVGLAVIIREFRRKQ
jgi:hypothetical protein